MSHKNYSAAVSLLKPEEYQTIGKARHFQKRNLQKILLYYMLSYKKTVRNIINLPF